MALQNLRPTTLKLLGRFPKTHEFEAKQDNLRKEYEEFVSFPDCEEYKTFIELENFAKSDEPEKIKRELKSLTFKNSEEQKLELELKLLSKKKTIRNYIRVKSSEKLELYRKVESSGKPQKHEDLKQFIQSLGYKNQRKEHKKNNSEEYQKEVEFKGLKKDYELKQYLKLRNWKPLQDFLKLEDSVEVNRYYELGRLLSSKEFIDRKEYLLSKNKFEQTSAYQNLKEYEKLKKAEKIIWYKKHINSKKFDEVKRWKNTFSEDFSKTKLDKNKWITQFYWGKTLIEQGYSLASDKHFYTNGNNIDVSNNSLKIITRKEKAEGLSWDKRFGFIPQAFEYTSGIVNTGQSFRQLYGKFEAKIRFTMAPNVYHAFWLVGDTMLPHIDVIRQNGGAKPSVQGSIFWQNGPKKPNCFKARLSGFNFSENFYILSLEWTPNKLEWKINGVTYAQTTSNIPKEPAYLVLSSGVNGAKADSMLPANLEVEWIRCWKMAKE